MRKPGPATMRTLAFDGNSADLNCPLYVDPAWPALMIEECESDALLTPGIASKRLRRSE